MQLDPPFLIQPVTQQIYEWTEKLAKVAAQRGLIPYYPEDDVRQLPIKDVNDMIKVELEVEANKAGVKLDRRKSVGALRQEVLAIRESK